MLRSPALSAMRATVRRLAQWRLMATKCKGFASVQGDLVSVQFPEGEHHKFPSAWLRDNCQCPECFNPQMQSRLINWRHFDISVRPVSIELVSKILHIKWSDNHNSYFELQWLKERNFTFEKQKKWINETYRLPKKTWNTKKFQTILKKFKFAEVIKSDQALLSWLQALAIYGVAIITETPKNKEELLSITNRIAFPKKTHYGEIFEVKIKPDATNAAYSNTPLQMHTDLPYYEYKPGINLLLCLEQTEGPGGENLLADGFYIASYMRDHYPEFYRLLSTVLVDWLDAGEEGGIRFHTLYRSPVICQDTNGQLVRINYSQPQRDSHFNVPLDTAVAWYKAYHAFTKTLYHPENSVLLKTKPGEILTFDNIRLLHAREGYTDDAGRERHIAGIYIDWDIAYACLRVLKQNSVAVNV